jgi:DinB family protein
MSKMRMVLLSAGVIVAATAVGEGAHRVAVTGALSPQQSPPATTIASIVDGEIGAIEKQLVDAAEAMPGDKFDFSPESVSIPGSDYKGVRTFGLQVRHVAASNYFLWASITGDRLPDDYKGGNGPAQLRTKAEIVGFLKDSFALGHKAAATLTAQNMLQPATGSKSSRLYMATFAVAHASDHYGQIVEYLRMNGIVPPASR